ncbi:MAG: AAA family ATPase [Candidatus Berkiella sp.]
MTDQLYEALAQSTSGYVIAPAGCGKTEAIVQAVKKYCQGRQLILTHTNAGVNVLRKRFIENNVSNSLYHIETISGWALRWIYHYPMLSRFSGALPLPQKDEWPLVYKATENLFTIAFVRYVIMNSYSGVIVDEYQDCTLTMHSLVLSLKKILPCRVLGDPLQGIFGFKEKLVEWSTIESDFGFKIGELLTPYRWINAGNNTLGDWLIQARNDFTANRLPNFSGSPINFEKVEPKSKSARLQSITRQLNGSICIIGPKHGNLSPALGTALINVGYSWVEPNELPDLNDFLVKLSANINDAKYISEAAINMLTISFTGLDKHKMFVEQILKGSLKREPIDFKRKKLFHKHPAGYSHSLLLDIISYLDSAKVKRKKSESIIFLKKVLEQHFETGEDLMNIFAKFISQRQIIGKGKAKRCIGTTLLLKGLEFDHAIILYNKSDRAWNNLKDIYVAITRGSKTVYIIE